MWGSRVVFFLNTHYSAYLDGASASFTNSSGHRYPDLLPHS
jgi:hypothetical protein